MMEPPEGLSPEERVTFYLDHARAHDSRTRCLMSYWGELVTVRAATTVHPGSQLDRHQQFRGKESQHLEVPTLAWRALARAGEHMSYAAFWSEATKGGVYGSPERTLARTIMLGSAKALFLLESDDPVERQVRAARIANQEADDAGRILGHGPERWAGALFRELKRQTEQLRIGAQRVLREAGRNERSSITETQILREVAPCLADGLDDPEAAVMVCWNKTSGAAHARSWTWDLGSGIHPAIEAAGIWSIPVAFAEKAWPLWNQRRGTDDPPAFPPEDWRPDPDRMLPPYDGFEAPVELPAWLVGDPTE